MLISAGEFHVISTGQETDNVAAWDRDKDLGLSLTILKNLEEAVKLFNTTIARENVTRCKLEVVLQYRDAHQQQSATRFILAHYHRGAKSLERFVERAREWSDHVKNPFEQTLYIHPVTNTRQLVSDAFKPTGTFVSPDEGFKEPEPKKKK